MQRCVVPLCGKLGGGIAEVPEWNRQRVWAFPMPMTAKARSRGVESHLIHPTRLFPCDCWHLWW